MKRQRGRRYRQRFADLAGGQAFRAGLNQQSKNAEARLLGERRQRGNNILGFHNSIIVEMFAFVNYYLKKRFEAFDRRPVEPPVCLSDSRRRTDITTWHCFTTGMEKHDETCIFQIAEAILDHAPVNRTGDTDVPVGTDDALPKAHVPHRHLVLRLLILNSDAPPVWRR